MKTVGLIVNPLAGMGGRVGLKGTDGAETLAKALALGARPEAGNKAAEALKELLPLAGELKIITCPGAMGEEAVRAAGFKPYLLESFARSDRTAAKASALRPEQSRPEDTERAARLFAEAGVDLLLFAGGDGTARNIFNALGEDTALPVVGIPAGVKIHSAVYAVNPRGAGRLAGRFLSGKITELRQAEIMDIDEDAFRRGLLTARLYGYLPVPVDEELMQHLKIGNMPAEKAVLEAIAEHVTENMEPGYLYIIGPGSTIAPVMQRLGLPNTLLGVDLVSDGRLLADDASEMEILEVMAGKKAKIVVTVIGGQGYIFGRGNQQISAAVIKQVGRDNIIVAATREKLLSLKPARLLVDTGDEKVNRMLAGYLTVVTGYHEQMIFPVCN